jgi:ABC-type nickel/cobalt efflux system permease component RcnA
MERDIGGRFDKAQIRAIVGGALHDRTRISHPLGVLRALEPHHSKALFLSFHRETI